MGVFSKIKGVINDSSLGKSQKAPSISTEMDRFLATIASNDLARSNIFLVRMEKHQSYADTGNQPISSGGSTLNGLGFEENSLVGQGISAITYNLRGSGQELLKNTLGPAANKLVKTGFGDYYDDLMGVSTGNINAADFDPTKTMGMYAEAVTLPSITAEVRKEHMQYQKKNLLMVSKDHSGLSITFRCSSNYAEYNYLRWLVDQKIDNKHNMVDFPDNFMLPQVCVFIYNRETNAVATSVNNRCVITSISSLEYSYENNNEVAKFTVEFMPEESKFETYSGPEIGLESIKGDINLARNAFGI